MATTTTDDENERLAEDCGRRRGQPMQIFGPLDAIAKFGFTSNHLPMPTTRLRVGQPITPDQFHELSDEQLERLVPKAWREFFPGKDFCADGCFYLHDGTAWSFFKAGFVDE